MEPVSWVSRSGRWSPALERPEGLGASILHTDPGTENSAVIVKEGPPEPLTEGLCLPGFQSEHAAQKTNGRCSGALFSASCGRVWGKELWMSGLDMRQALVVAYSPAC